MFPYDCDSGDMKAGLRLRPSNWVLNAIMEDWEGQKSGGCGKGCSESKNSSEQDGVWLSS